jgi:hypothetical protein
MNKKKVVEGLQNLYDSYALSEAHEILILDLIKYFNGKINW